MLSTVFAIIAIAMLAVAGVLAINEHRWLCAAQLTDGKVVEMVQTRGSKGKRSYAPRVEFIARDGASHSFTSNHSSNPPDYSVGDKVTVAYDAKSGGRIVAFGERFGVALIVGSVGLAILMVVTGLTLGRHYVPRIYLERDGMLLQR